MPEKQPNSPENGQGDNQQEDSDSAEQLHSEPKEGSALLTMFASEAVLRREWDTPEEDEAWANL